MSKILLELKPIKVMTDLNKIEQPPRLTKKLIRAFMGIAYLGLKREHGFMGLSAKHYVKVFQKEASKRSKGNTGKGKNTFSTANKPKSYVDEKGRTVHVVQAKEINVVGVKNQKTE